MFGKKKRQKELEALAGSWGLSYSPKDESGIRDSSFDLLTSRWIRNVVSGTWRERNLTAFDYDQVVATRPGKSAQVYKYTCAMGEVGTSLPKVRIEGHGGYADWILGKPKGLSPVETGNNGLDPSFRVLSSDPAAWDTFLTPALREWMLSLGPGWSFELADRGVLCSTGLLAPPAFPSILDTVSDLLDRLQAS
jgi:hypothetical protein